MIASSSGRLPLWALVARSVHRGRHTVRDSDLRNTRLNTEARCTRGASRSGLSAARSQVCVQCRRDSQSRPRWATLGAEANVSWDGAAIYSSQSAMAFRARVNRGFRGTDQVPHRPSDDQSLTAQSTMAPRRTPRPWQCPNEVPRARPQLQRSKVWPRRAPTTTVRAIEQGTRVAPT